MFSVQQILRGIGIFLFIIISFLIPTSIQASDIIGDANSDGCVNELDYAIWINYYSQTTTNTSDKGGFNNDNKTNSVDYALWLNNYSSNCIPSPKPSASGIIVSPIPILCPPIWTNNTINLETEKIVFAIEAETSQKYPDYQNRSKQMIDYLNNVLAKTTRKRYIIEKFQIFSLDQYNNLSHNSEFHFDNSYGGTTIFFYLHPIQGAPKVVTDTGLVNVTQKVSINSKTYYNIWLVFNEAGGFEVSNIIATPLHELGHTLGLALGEWYSYEFSDLTGMAPNLGIYSYRQLFPNDPMTSSGSTDFQFSDFNSFVINNNPTHQYDFVDISEFHSSRVKVRVTDSGGNPISNAQVFIFGAKKNCYYCQPLQNPTIPLQQLNTDAQGDVEIDNISPIFYLNETSDTGWIAKYVKVAKDGKNSGTVLTLVDTQTSCIINGSNIHYIHIQL